MIIPKKAETIDLEEIVTNWAWRQYARTATKKQKKLREKEKKKNVQYISVEIDWNSVTFRDDTTWPKCHEVGFDQDEKENGETSSVEKSSAGEKAIPKSSILFSTQYTNDTNHEQEYTMKTEKTTRTSCETFIENTFTRGYQMGVCLKTPGELFELNAGYSREMSLTQSEGQVIEEEMTWSVESLIKVDSNHVAHARLVVDERKFNGNFVVKTTCDGLIHVTFRNIKDSNKIIKVTTDRLYKIVQQYLKTMSDLQKKNDFIEIQNDQVIITTKGVCNFRFGIKQEVHVTQSPIES